MAEIEKPLTSKVVLPRAIGIGVQRSGTSWVRERLREHPALMGAPGTHYFSHNYSESLNWYSEHLIENQSGIYPLDYSVSYCYPPHYEEVARRIANTVPSVRLIMCVRHPVNRTISDYRRSASLLEIDPNARFRDTLKCRPDLWERSLYGEIISTFLAYFSRSQIHVIIYERLFANPIAELARLQDFLGLQSAFSVPPERKSIYSPNAVRSRLVYKAIWNFKSLIDAAFNGIGLTEPWRRFKSRYMPLYHRLLSINEQNRSVASDGDQKWLHEKYRGDVRLFRDLIDDTIYEWDDI
jgi:hypothetical protein